MNSSPNAGFAQFKKEHKQLSKSELISMLFYLKKKLEKIESLLHIYDNANTPSSKKRFKEKTEKAQEIKKDPDKKRFPGRPEGHDGAGVKLPKPDAVVEHALDDARLKVVGKRIQTVIDFVDNPLLVTQHIIFKYLSLDGIVVEPVTDLPAGIYGKNLQAFVATLKGTFGVSHDNIAVLLKSIRPDISFCGATSLKITDGISNALQPVRNQILGELRQAVYSNADETVFRQDGQNGYIWTFCNEDNILYEYDLSRSHKVPERILGQYYTGWVVCDGYGGYNAYKKQRCWCHLLSEFKEIVDENKELEKEMDYFKSVYRRALEAKKEPPDERTKIVEKLDSEDELGSCIARLSNNKKTEKFATTLKNARPYLFTGVIYPEIPLDNNHAERVLRKMVVHRNIMGCIRNKKGETFINNAMSAIQTWRQKNLNVYQKLKEYAA